MIKFLLGVVVVAAIFWFGLGFKQKLVWQRADNFQRLEPSSSTEENQVEDKFVNEINQLIATNSAKIAVDFIDLKSGKEYQFRAQDQFFAASTIKTLVASYALSQIEAGKVSEKQPLGSYDVITQVKFMVNVSSNPSWELLNDFFGIENIEKFGRSLGMKQIDLNNTLISAADLALLLKKLYYGEVLTDKYKTLLFSYMQNTESEDRISKGLPEGTKFYHRSGTFSDVIHDIAIIDDGKRPFVLVVLTSGSATEKFKIAKIIAITQKAWQFANR